MNLTGRAGRGHAALPKRHDLERSIRWEGETLWTPRPLQLLLEVIDRYELAIVPDSLLVFPALGAHEQVTTKYFQRFGFSEAAERTFERLLGNLPSGRALENLVRFVRESGFCSEATLATLRGVAASAERSAIVRVDAMQVLAAHDEPNEYFAGLRLDPEPAVAHRAFGILIDRQDRGTIERELARLLGDDSALRAGEVGFPRDSPLDWIGKIRADFAWKKLKSLRRQALRLKLSGMAHKVTETLAGIDRRAAAIVIHQQLDATPPAWRNYAQARALELEQIARIEEAQRTQFDAVLLKLRGSTSADKLCLVCEGSTDEPVFRKLLAQVRDVPEVLFDWAGGWPGLVNKDPHVFLRGAKAAIVVMDGDDGRKLRKKNRPLTRTAKKQEARLKAAGVELRVLRRYGIENYFPRRALEKVLENDLASYFPLPDDVAIQDHLSVGARGIWLCLRRLVARVFNLASPISRQPFYSKSRNGDVAEHIDLERDLVGTDLHAVIHEIGEKARDLARE
jgi:hypothetical protein